MTGGSVVVQLHARRCPVWCRRHEEVIDDDPGVFLHVLDVGQVVLTPDGGRLRVRVVQAGGVVDGVALSSDPPVVELYWPEGDHGEELPAVPFVLVLVAQLLTAAAEALQKKA